MIGSRYTIRTDPPNTPSEDKWSAKISIKNSPYVYWGYGKTEIEAILNATKKMKQS